MGLGIHCANQLANELHMPVRRRVDKRTVFTQQVDDWAADLVGMSSFSGLQISLENNRCIQQVWLDRTIENQNW